MDTIETTDFDYSDWQQKEIARYAFPGKMIGLIGNVEQEVPIPGLTKREAFAMAAMQGLLAREGWAERIASELSGNATHAAQLVRASVNMADELLKQLEQVTTMDAIETKTLAEEIADTFVTGKMILDENPTLDSMSFTLTGYSVSDVETAAAMLNRESVFSSVHSSVCFCISQTHNEKNIFIHVYSVEVKAKVVYE